MARIASCTSCLAKLPKGAAFCPACGRPTGLELEQAGLETDDELDRQPITVEPERPHGLRNLAIAAGVVVLFVGGALILNRNDGKTPATATASSTSTTTATTVPNASSTTTSTSTTIAPPSTSAWIDLAPKGPLLPEPTGTVLYGTTPNGRLLRIDLDTGVVTVRRVDLGEAGGAQFILRGEQLVVSGPDVSHVSVLARDLRGSARELNLDEGTRVLPGPAPDELWVVSDNGPPGGTGSERYVQRIHLDGTPAGPRLPLASGSPGTDDGAGRVMVYVGGASSTYVLDPVTGVPTRLTIGFPLAVDANRVVDVVCDEHLACQLRVTDRATGASRLVPATAPAQAVNGGGAVLSPDGRWLALVVDGGTMFVVDLNDGALRRFDDFRPGPYWGQGPSWSPDGRWLFWSGGSSVYAWRAGSPTAVVVGGGDLPELTGVVAMPAAG